MRTPSATLPPSESRISGSLRPWPSCSTVRLRLSGPVQSTRSPMPERPARVSRRAPEATARRVISALAAGDERGGGVVAETYAYCDPAAMAMTFLSAPPSSTPITSVDV